MNVRMYVRGCIYMYICIYIQFGLKSSIKGAKKQRKVPDVWVG